MKSAITGYHKDIENHWVAELSCGHFQHVRHTPPWSVRPWVLTKQGRDNKIGVLLDCKSVTVTSRQMTQPAKH